MLRIRIWDPVPFWPLDPGSHIPNPYFWELSDNFLGKKFYNALKIGPNFFLWHFKTKNYFQFCEICGYINKVWQEIFFHPSLLLLFLDPGSGMGKNQDPGSGINIPDPQHCENPRYFGSIISEKGWIRSRIRTSWLMDPDPDHGGLKTWFPNTNYMSHRGLGTT